MPRDDPMRRGMLRAADTAFAIAHVRALEDERPAHERLFSDPLAALFRDAGAHAIEGTQRFLSLPMFVDGLRLRTRFIDDLVRTSLRAGTTQLVLLGAGFDTRALRLPEVREHGATVFEVDFAEQLETKRTLLSNVGVELPAWLHHVACDFDASDFEVALLAALRDGGLEAGAPVLYIWEGVIAYLGAAAVDRTLRFIATTSAPGSRVVFDFAPIAFGEAPAAERARRAGFSSFEESSFGALWRRYLPTPPHENASFACMGVATV